MASIEYDAIVGDFEGGDGAKVHMDADGISIDNGDKYTRVDWAVWNMVQAEVVKYHRAVEAVIAEA